MKRTLTTAELASATYATYNQAGVHLNAAAFLATPAGPAEEGRSIHAGARCEEAGKILTIVRISIGLAERCQLSSRS